MLVVACYIILLFLCTPQNYSSPQLLNYRKCSQRDGFNIARLIFRFSAKSFQLKLFGKTNRSTLRIPGNNAGYLPQETSLKLDLSIMETMEFYGAFFGEITFSNFGSTKVRNYPKITFELFFSKNATNKCHTSHTFAHL